MAASQALEEKSAGFLASPSPIFYPSRSAITSTPAIGGAISCRPLVVKDYQFFASGGLGEGMAVGVPF